MDFIERRHTSIALAVFAAITVYVPTVKHKTNVNSQLMLSTTR